MHQQTSLPHRQCACRIGYACRGMLQLPHPLSPADPCCSHRNAVPFSSTLSYVFCFLSSLLPYVSNVSSFTRRLFVSRVLAEYVVQGHRFNLYEDVGCYPALYNTALAYVLNSMWPVILGLISATYCSTYRMPSFHHSLLIIPYSQCLHSVHSTTDVLNSANSSPRTNP